MSEVDRSDIGSTSHTSGPKASSRYSDSVEAKGDRAGFFGTLFWFLFSRENPLAGPGYLPRNNQGFTKVNDGKPARLHG